MSAVDTGELTSEGLRLERTAVLTAKEVTEPPHPNRSATIRELAGDDDWRQSAALRQRSPTASQDLSRLFLEARIRAERGLTEAGYGSWFGAFTDGRLEAQLGLVTDGSASPAIRTWRPIPMPAGWDWPGCWSGMPDSTGWRPLARRRW